MSVSGTYLPPYAPNRPSASGRAVLGGAEAVDDGAAAAGATARGIGRGLVAGDGRGGGAIGRAACWLARAVRPDMCARVRERGKVWRGAHTYVGRVKKMKVEQSFFFFSVAPSRERRNKKAAPGCHT